MWVCPQNPHILAHFGGSGAEFGPFWGFRGQIRVHFGGLGDEFGSIFKGQRLDFAHFKVWAGLGQFVFLYAVKVLVLRLISSSLLFIRRYKASPCHAHSPIVTTLCLLKHESSGLHGHLASILCFVLYFQKNYIQFFKRLSGCRIIKQNVPWGMFS